MRINVPNQLTLARLALAAVFFALLSLFSATGIDKGSWVLKVCFVVFLVAVLTDVLDGLLARVLKQETKFGRIVDPVVDKVIVCGAFVYLAGSKDVTGVQPWMVIVILARELLVTAIRSHSESAGKDFSAVWMGKVKMFVQSFTVCAILCILGWELDDRLPYVRIIAIWATVLITALSIVSYVRRAHAFLLSSEALGDSSDSAPPPDEAADEPPAAEAPRESPKGDSD